MANTSRVLRPGEAIPLSSLLLVPGAALQVCLVCDGPLPDLVALLVGDAGKVRSDDDLVFYNNPISLEGAVHHRGTLNAADWMQIHPERLDADVTRVVFGCSGGVVGAGGTASLSLRLLDLDGTELASATFPVEASYRAMILLEVYRRAGEWRCRLLAQGYAGGLAALVTEFGVVVDDAGDEANGAAGDEAASVTPPAPAAPDLDPWTPRSLPPIVLTPPSSLPAPATSPRQVTGLRPGELYLPAAQQQPQPYPLPPPPADHLTPANHPPGWTPPAAAPRPRGLFTSRKRQELEARNAELNRLLVTSGAMDVAALAAERDHFTAEIAALAVEADRRRADLASLDQRLTHLRSVIAMTEGEVELTEAGIYRYRHRLDDAIAYKARIDSLRDRIKTVAQTGRAVTGSTGWSVDGSQAKGRTMVNEVSKLMLRAYNADADHAVRTMRAYKLDSALARLDTTRSTITRLGKTMSIEISAEYHRLRREELELTADYLSKAEEEKERQRLLREQAREEQRADAEYKREQERLQRERQRYASAVTQLESRGDTAKADEVRAQLNSVDAAIAGLEYRLANRRLGHVYVISNIGAFGEHMVKIGMTRRLNPEDRIRELGDASVPFRFDKHALIFSEDAVSLETALHQRFAGQRVNRVNAHREFFYVSPAEVRTALAEMGTQYLLEYTEQIEAPEWRQSGGPERSILPT